MWSNHALVHSQNSNRILYFPQIHVKILSRKLEASSEHILVKHTYQKKEKINTHHFTYFTDTKSPQIITYLFQHSPKAYIYLSI